MWIVENILLPIVLGCVMMIMGAVGLAVFMAFIFLMLSPLAYFQLIENPCVATPLALITWAFIMGFLGMHADN
ncbi:MAG TPA: hypothetical protein ENH82_03830 [bacterium]|nr:hypothetical protein [bacterium]